MSNWYEENLAVLRKRNPAWDGFSAAVPTDGYRLVNAATGQPGLVIEKAGRSIPIDVASSPALAVQQWLPIPDQRPHLFLVFAAGLGYTVFELVQRFPESRFLIVEKDAAIFKKALEAFDYRSYLQDPRLEFLVGVETKDLQLAFVNYLRTNDHSDYLPAATVVCNRDNLADHTDYYRIAGESFTSAVSYFWDVVVGNSIDDGLLGLNNTLTNVTNLHGYSGLSPYAGLFAGRTGIIVSSGPSLNNKLAQLRAVQDRAVIICADSALRILLKHGITPFGVSCVERHGLVPSLFRGFAIPPAVVLFTTPIVDPLVLQEFPGPVSCVFPALKLFQWVPKIGPLIIPGASCAHFAYQVLQYLGCSEVAVLGQDLAFDRYSGGTHVQGIAGYAAEDDAKQNHFLLPDNQGGTIESHHWWSNFRNIFIDMIRYSQVPLLNVIEADRGARIDGALLTEPQDFFARLQKAEPFNPLFDPSLGQQSLAQALPEFTARLRAKTECAVRELIAFDACIDTLTTATDAEDYLAKLKQATACFSEATALLFWHLTSPDIKRVNAAMRSLWDAQEVRAQLPVFGERLKRTLAKIGDALTNVQTRSLTMTSLEAT